MECLEKAKAEHLRAINEMLGTAGSPYATTRQIDSTDHTHTSPKRGRLRAHQQQHHHDTQWALDSQGCTSTLSSIGPSQASSVGAHPSSTSGTPSPMMGVAATPIEDPFALPGDLPRKKPAAKAQRTQQNARGNTEERYRRLVEELGVLTESVPGAMVGGQPAEGGVTERIPLRTVQPPVLPLRSTPVLPPLVAAEEGGGGSAVVSPVQRARQMEQEQRDVEWESRQKQYAAREQERIDRRERRGKRKEERAEGVLRAKATVVVEEVKVTEVTVVKVEVRCPPKPTALVQLPEDCVRDETHARVCQHRKERVRVRGEKKTWFLVCFEYAIVLRFLLDGGEDERPSQNILLLLLLLVSQIKTHTFPSCRRSLSQKSWSNGWTSQNTTRGRMESCPPIGRSVQEAGS